MIQSNVTGGAPYELLFLIFYPPPLIRCMKGNITCCMVVKFQLRSQGKHLFYPVTGDPRGGGLGVSL